MKKAILLCLLLAVGSLWAGTAFAQGTFTLTNNTFQNYNYRLVAAEDWCGAANASPLLPAPPLNVATFTAPGTWTGAFKALIILDPCGQTFIVEHPQQCFFGAPTFLNFTDCTGNNATVIWVNELTGFII
ncbi:MAG: hypothetical protein ACFB10_16255 [Salibacteraceae bacterium]